MPAISADTVRSIMAILRDPAVTSVLSQPAVVSAALEPNPSAEQQAALRRASAVTQNAALMQKIGRVNSELQALLSSAGESV